MKEDFQLLACLGEKPRTCADHPEEKPLVALGRCRSNSASSENEEKDCATRRATETALVKSAAADEKHKWPKNYGVFGSGRQRVRRKAREMAGVKTRDLR